MSEPTTSRSSAGLWDVAAVVCALKSFGFRVTATTTVSNTVR
ncbi:MAG: hypothetical protein Q7S84_03090 [bacterium]|nr:hypothetical protein [bacterium]